MYCHPTADGCRPRLKCVVTLLQMDVDPVWNVMAHSQKPDFVFRRNGRVHLNQRGCQFNRLLAAELCASAVTMLDKPCSEVVWKVLAAHSIRQFPLHFPSRGSPCTITFQLHSATHTMQGTQDTKTKIKPKNAQINSGLIYYWSITPTCFGPSVEAIIREFEILESYKAIVLIC